MAIRGVTSETSRHDGLSELSLLRLMDMNLEKGTLLLTVWYGRAEEQYESGC